MRTTTLLAALALLAGCAANDPAMDAPLQQMNAQHQMNQMMATQAPMATLADLAEVRRAGASSRR